MNIPFALWIRMKRALGRGSKAWGFAYSANAIDSRGLPPACKATLIGGVLGLAFAPAPVLPQPEAGGPRADVVVLSDFPWETVEWIERRYKIEVMRFKARDETGWDWWGSDEVMVGTDDAKGSTVSNEIGDIDSGDTHHFDPAKSCIIAVRPGVVVLDKTSLCDDVGEPAPLGFEVELWEKDYGILGGFCKMLSPGPGRHAGPHCVNDGSGDDFIGRARLDFSAQDFEVLPNVGDEFIETVVLDPCPGAACASPWLPDYSFTYRTTRLRDRRVDLRAVLNEAMQRSGARSELEAIVTGLRSLRAPSPRKTEPKTAR
jgi:hypothetical protein